MSWVMPLREMRVASLCEKYNIMLHPFEYAGTYTDLHQCCWGVAEVILW